MPIAAATSLVTEARIARDMIVTLLIDNQEDLQLGYIGKDDESRLPGYPAVVVSAGGKEKNIHSTHKFSVLLSCIIWVYHANLDIGHASRSDEDLLLVEKIERVVEADLGMNLNLIHSWIESVQPGMFQPRSSKGAIVIGTRMLWSGLSQQSFR